MSEHDFQWCKKVMRIGVHDFLLLDNKLFVELQIDIDGEDNLEYKWIDVSKINNEKKKVDEFRRPKKPDSVELQTTKGKRQ